MEHSLDITIQYCKGVGPKRVQLFEKLGVRRVCDLLHFYPRTYLDYSQPVSIAGAPQGEICVIRARVIKKARPARIRKGMTLYKILVTDDTGDAELTFFNTQIPSRLLAEGKTYRFRGRLEGSLLKRTMSSPLFIPDKAACIHQPVYPQTAGLSSGVIAKAVSSALDLFDQLNPPDPIPERILSESGYCSQSCALHEIHAPSGPEELESAQKRLAFEELLVLQLGLLQMRSDRMQAPKTAPGLSDTDWRPFLRSLPFAPTKGQLQAIEDCLTDFSAGKPMNRLLQGDVGSGKTLVAAVLAYLAAKNGFQTALMAPTELLAQQHFASFKKFFAPFGISCAVLCGSTSKKEKDRIKEEVADGRIDVLIGTHALLQSDVIFHRLFLTITDEQHRFGVAQRAALHQKQDHIHHLVLSATPIPRTLALILYGDLDISVIREKPPGRQPIRTYVVPERKRTDLYTFLLKKIEEGQQAYIVCPLIDSEDPDELGSAVAYKKSLEKTVLAGCRIGLMHGRLKSEEKDRIMEQFRTGQLDLLISTTVIEVGVDVPSATVMVIEEAHRFGLSQLHQLRGRVGRGTDESFCFLLSRNCPESAKERLRFLASCSDGFKIAEYDLQQRGPGNFFGYAQHGLPDLKMAAFLTDTRIADDASRWARRITEEDPALQTPQNRGLAQAVSNLFSSVGGSLD